MNKTLNHFMNLIRGEITGEVVGDFASLSEAEWEKICGFSLQYDLAPIVANSIANRGLTLREDIQSVFFDLQLDSVMRYEKIKYTQEALFALFEEQKIAYIPLKGSVIRPLYPEPWMRTSCDIDVLIHPSDLERACFVLTEKLQWTKGGKGTHDVSFTSSVDVRVELHYDLIEAEATTEGILNRKWNVDVLDEVWEQALPAEDFTWQRKMPDALSYFYHIAHMAKHFEHGGAGIRPFIDLWLLNHKVEFEQAERDRLLQDAGLYTFAESVRALSEVWFSGEAYKHLTEKIAEFIINGSIYGTVENRVAVQQSRHGGKLRYAFDRIFLPYEALQHHYAVLKKHKWLMPFCQVRRWCKLLFLGGAKRSALELKQNQIISKEKIETTSDLMDSLGL